jgi:hypothetical protein
MPQKHAAMPKILLNVSEIFLFYAQLCALCAACEKKERGKRDALLGYT